MAITFDLKPEVEARLMAQATLYGVSMEAYLESLIQAHLAHQEKKPVL